MAYEPRIQRDAHSITFACWCGRTSRHRLSPTSHRIRCRVCGRTAVIGNAIFDVTRERSPRPPCDLAIPRQASDDAAIPYPAEPADERTVYGGKWHSAEPITLDMPGHDRPLPEQWRDRLTGTMWHAVSYAMATRWLAAPDDDPTDRQTIGHREWRERMIRVEN